LTEDARDTFQPIEEVIIERWDGGGPTSRAADILERITRYIDFDIVRYLDGKETKHERD
jgi:hypothetical protein